MNISLLIKSIWMEKYQPDESQTLISKLLAKLSRVSLVYMVFFILTYPLRYIYGPLPEKVCFTQTMLGSVVVLQFLMIYIAVTVTTYSFIFILKNPLAIEDGFWCNFIYRWTIITGFLIQLTVSALPGAQ